MKKWQIAISVLLVFAIGTAAGAYGSRVMFKKKIHKALQTEGTPGITVMKGMMGRLDLSESQRTSINAILDENNKKWETIREEYWPKIEELYETAIEETKKVLTDEQRNEIERMSAEVQGRLPRRNYSRPRSSPDSSAPPRSLAPQDNTSGPPATTRPFGQKSDDGRIAGIIERLQIEEEKSAEVQSIIEEDLVRQQVLREDFEKSQANAEEKFQKDLAADQSATEKKLEGLLTPEQMETYRRIMNPEERRPENFGEDFGFDVPGDAAQMKDFNQGDLPVRPEGQPGSTQSPPPMDTSQGSRSI